MAIFNEKKMPDFLDEVQEDIKREKFEDIFKKFGLHFGAAIAIIIGGTGFFTWYDSHLLEKKEISGYNYAKALKGDVTELDIVIEEGSKGYANLAALKKANIVARSNKEKAIELYEQIASASSVDKATRDMAVLKMAYLMIETGKNEGKIEKLLKSISKKGSPFRYSAIEMAGIYKIKKGDISGAKDEFSEITKDAFAPENMRIRAEKILSNLEG